MFVLGTSIGHCGTRWLATFLNQLPDSVVFYHEKLQKMLGNWKVPFLLSRKHGLDHKEFDAYFNCIEQDRRRRRVVGDIGSWQACEIPAVAERIAVNRVLYIVRNGIVQAHSRSKSYRKKGLFDVFAKLRWEELGQPFFDDWSTVTEWEKWCLEWWTSIEYISWLQTRLPNIPVIVYRFEDLIADVAVLSVLVQSLGLKPHTLKRWQKRDINRHLPGNRTPGHIWKQWTKGQRDTFIRFCSGKMREIGYA